MAAYFYHFRTPEGSLILDDIGNDLETDEEAVREGILAAAELIRSARLTGGAFEIHDEAGGLVERVPFSRH